LLRNHKTPTSLKLFMWTPISHIQLEFNIMSKIVDK